VKKVLFIGASAALIVIVLWLVLSYDQEKEHSSNIKNTQTLLHNNILDSDLDAIVTAAKTTQPFQYGGYIFAMPTNMVQSVGEGGVSWYFSTPVKNTPLISFQQSVSPAQDLVNMEKEMLPNDQKVVREGTMEIHGQSWKYLEITSNLDINSTYWFSETQPTVEIIISHGPTQVMDIFQKIIESATVEKQK
jgi:hypothetical protein